MGTTADGGKGSKGRAANGDRPIGAASCRRDHHTMASCQPPPPPHRSPCQENHPADAHPGTLKSVLASANLRMDSECASGCTWSTAQATAPSPGRPTPGVVKRDKSSGGSVDTTKTRSGPQGVRMSSGERPIGAAKGKQSDTEALCQPPPPPHTQTVKHA